MNHLSEHCRPPVSILRLERCGATAMKAVELSMLQARRLTAWKSREKGWHKARLPFCLACCSAGTILFSIAISQICLAMGLAALLISGDKIRFPPIKTPLALFSAATVASLLLSGDPASGLPQIRKFFVFAIVLLIYSTFHSMKHVKLMVLIWSLVGALSAMRAIEQFVQRVLEAREEHAYQYYFFAYDRVTGFASHWMTFGGEQMIVLLVLTSFLLFSQSGKWKVFGWACASILYVSAVLGLTRSVFLCGVPAGGAYLLWHWNRRVLAVAPAVLAVALAASPMPVRDRVASVVQSGQADSGTQRIVMWRTGWQMIKAHPWFGLGPEQIQSHFQEYVPAGIPRPLPAGWYGHLHNIYLQYAAERGVPCLGMMLWLIAKVLYDFSRAVRQRNGSSDLHCVLYGAIAVVLAVLAEGVFEYNLGDSEVLTMFLSVITCGYVVRGQITSLQNVTNTTMEPAELTVGAA